MKTITSKALADKFRSVNSSFVSFVTETDPKMKKGGRGGLATLESLGYDSEKFVKVSKFVALIGSKVEYEKLVENRIDRKTDHSSEEWVASPRKWGTRIDAVEVIHNDESYITAHFVSNNKVEVIYLYEGTPIDLKEKGLLDYLPSKSHSEKQADVGLEGSLEVVHREYNAKSIKSFTMDGETYIVIG